MNEPETMFVTCCNCQESGVHDVELIFNYPPLGQWVCDNCGCENFFDGSEESYADMKIL